MAPDPKNICHPWPTMFPALCFNQVYFAVFQVLSDHFCAFPTACTGIEVEELSYVLGTCFRDITSPQ